MNEWALGGLIEGFSMLQTVDESEVNLGSYKKHLLYSKTEINQAGIGSNFPQFTRHLTARATRMPPCAGAKTWRDVSGFRDRWRDRSRGHFHNQLAG